MRLKAPKTHEPSRLFELHETEQQYLRPVTFRDSNPFRISRELESFENRKWLNINVEKCIILRKVLILVRCSPTDVVLMESQELSFSVMDPIMETALKTNVTSDFL